MKPNHMAAPLALALALGGSTAVLAQATKVDSAIPGYSKTSGVSGNLSSVGSDTLNNLMTLWAEGLQEGVSERPHPDRGQGLVDGAAGADPGHLAARADEPHHEGGGDRRLREEVRLQADRGPRRGRRHRRLRQQGQPDQVPDHAADRRHLLEGPRLRRQGDQRLGRGRRRPAGWGEPADQPLRPQLRLRHLRLLQGARALQGRLPRHRQGAAGLGLGGPGRHRGQVRHRLQRHRLQDLGRARRARGGQARPAASTTIRRT